MFDPKKSIDFHGNTGSFISMLMQEFNLLLENQKLIITIFQIILKLGIKKKT